MADQRERRHILFVDDDSASRRVIERVLRAGVPAARLTCVGEGEQALALLDASAVDLLITDLGMPGMDGIELLRQVANRRISVPVIVVTGRGGPTDETRALSGGAIEFFEKPIQAEPFIRCVQGLLAANEHRSRLEGVSIAGFVQLLHMERKTCALRVTTPDSQGVLFFSSGVLVDARWDDHIGVAAALEIFTWKDAVITLDALSRGRVATIQLSVTELLLESARLADERERNNRRAQVQAVSNVRHEAMAAGGGKGGLSLVPSPAPASPRRQARSVPVVEPEPRRPPPEARVSPPDPDLMWAEELETPPPPRLPAPQPRASAVQQAAWERPGAQAKIAATLAEAMKFEGAIGAALANWELDQCLGAEGGRGALRLDVAVSGNCRVMRALSACMARVGQKGGMQDVLITLDTQLHILTPLVAYERLFLYVALDRGHSNLALARHRIAKIVGDLVF